MAKKHQYRASAAEKKKRKEEAQRQKTKAFLEKYKLHLIIAAILLVVVIVAAVLINNSMYYAGSLKVQNGAVAGDQSNWMVKNLGTYSKPKYYKLGEVDIPAGYIDRGALVSDPVERNFFLAAEDENAILNQMTILAMKNCNPKAAAAVNSDNAPYIDGAFATYNKTLAGHDVHLQIGVCENQMADAEGNFTDFLGYYKQMAAYVQTAQDCAIKVTAFTPDYMTMEEMPTDEEVMAQLETIFANIRVEEN